MKDDHAEGWKVAAQKSLDERWLTMSQAQSTRQMLQIFGSTKCALCVYRRKLVGDNSHSCSPKEKTPCPLLAQRKGKYPVCCTEYSNWCDAVMKQDIEAAKAAVDELVTVLQTIAKTGSR